MKTLAIMLFPLLASGLILPGDSCHTIKEEKKDPQQLDGPYVLYQNDRVFAKYIYQVDTGKTVRADSLLLDQKKDLILHVNTDIPGKTFTVQLKPTLENEKAEYPAASKMLILSDIEGNFGALRKLLQMNGVIDTSFNWTFGDGNLVLIGDFCDRGHEVTEVFWFIYSLEEKAKVAGGYIHFVLGNHEIMNMSGDIRYLHGKYLEAETLLKERYESLYGVNSELGRWLRTKNIVEKVGDLLFVHGGISPEMNRMDISLSALNELTRPFYADTVARFPDHKLDTIYGDLGPFWYRGYYRGAVQTNSKQLDSTLAKFGNKYVVTGHTVIADTISVKYAGRVFNTDVHHAGGKSEALLLEDKKFYRVDDKGNKVLLRYQN